MVSRMTKVFIDGEMRDATPEEQAELANNRPTPPSPPPFPEQPLSRAKLDAALRAIGKSAGVSPEALDELLTD
jgi:hypothetical protein